MRNGHDQEFHIDTSAGYEKRDISLRTIIRWIIGLYVFVALTTALIYPLYMLLIPREGREGLNLRQPRDRPRPPEPVIQPHPVQDMRKFEAEQRRALESYGWVDKQKGIVRIPIEEAMDRLVATGLPSEGAAPPPAPPGVRGPSDTTSPPPAGAAGAARPGNSGASGGRTQPSTGAVAPRAPAEAREQ